MFLKKRGDYIPNMKKYKEVVEDIVNKMEEDAPANAVGDGSAVSLPPAVEPGVLKKKKKKPVMTFISRRIKENNDNNNIILKQILDGLDKVELKIDSLTEKQEIVVEEKKEHISFRKKYNV